MIKVLLVDDHASVRESLRSLLDRTGDIRVIATAMNGAEAIVEAGSYLPDIAVMDVSMPVMGGIEATRQIRAQFPTTRVMILSAYNDAEYVKHALEVGASGFVLKDTAGDDLIAGIRLVHMGKHYFSQKVAEIAKKYMKQEGRDGLVD